MHNNMHKNSLPTNQQPSSDSSFSSTLHRHPQPHIQPANQPTTAPPSLPERDEAAGQVRPAGGCLPLPTGPDPRPLHPQPRARPRRGDRGGNRRRIRDRLRLLRAPSGLPPSPRRLRLLGRAAAHQRRDPRARSVGGIRARFRGRRRLGVPPVRRCGRAGDGPLREPLLR